MGCGPAGARPKGLPTCLCPTSSQAKQAGKEREVKLEGRPLEVAHFEPWGVRVSHSEIPNTMGKRKRNGSHGGPRKRARGNPRRPRSASRRRRMRSRRSSGYKGRHNLNSSRTMPWVLDPVKGGLPTKGKANFFIEITGNHGMALGSGSVEYTCNSMYDPGRTNSNSQPAYFDEANGLYLTYKVVSVSFTIRMYLDGDQPVRVIMFPEEDDAQGPDIADLGCQMLTRLPFSKTAWISDDSPASNGGGRMLVMKYHLNLKKFMGADKYRSADYTPAGFAGDPTKKITMHLIFQSFTGSDPGGGIYYVTEIKYHTILTGGSTAPATTIDTV